jgi:hypothetical protein
MYHANGKLWGTPRYSGELTGPSEATSAANCSAAAALMPGSRCWEVCIVKAGCACPSRSLTTLIGTPAATSNEACVWRRSWNRTRGNPARRTVRSKSWLIDSRLRNRPLALQNSQSSGGGRRPRAAFRGSRDSWERSRLGDGLAVVCGAGAEESCAARTVSWRACSASHQLGEVARVRRVAVVDPLDR